MFKKSLIALLIVGLLVPTAFAFTFDDSLSVQINTLDGAVLSGDTVTLENQGLTLNGLFINPNFPTERDMYLSTSGGVYLNRQYDATFTLHAGLTALFPNGVTEIKFASNYAVTGIMLAYNKDKLYISNNRGDSWIDSTPQINEDILSVDFGPNYAGNQKLYFITNSGLYRYDVNSFNVTKLVNSTTPGSIMNFRYLPTQTVDNIFYVVNGDTILKTENYGVSWLSHAFTSDIKDFELIDKTPMAHLMVLTEDNKINYATDDFNFFISAVPSAVTTIYAVNNVIQTNDGFYITYNDGDSWSKLNYSVSSVADIKDYDFVWDGVSQSLYAINGNTLNRDANLNEVFTSYMAGVDGSSAYSAEGTVISKNILDLNAEQFTNDYIVKDAILVADADFNGQTIDFYMTADGVNWEEVEHGVPHTFVNKGTNLKWKAVLATDDFSVTPELNSISIDFGLEELTGCAGFSDVAVDDPYCTAIEYVKAQGIFSGYPDGTFGIDTEIVRAETVKVITEGFDVTMLEDDGTDLGFSDVELGAWYMGYLNTAKTEGIIEGYPDGTFKPANVVNYAEMIKIFFETAGADVPDAALNSQWYKKYVDYAQANGFTVYSNVDTGMKRADVAQLFYDWSLL